MAVVLGVNAGFVTEAPEGDPDGTGTDYVDDLSWGNKYTSPAGAIKVTELGWYCQNATEESNFEMAIYTHDSGDDEPGDIVGSKSATNAKGTGAGWKRVTGLNIEISASTIYWIALQVDNTTTTTRTDYQSIGGTKHSLKAESSTLSDPWGDSHDYENNFTNPFYAVYETEAPFTEGTAINIGDAWKAIAALKINIGDAWKNIASAKINIGDVWKVLDIA